MTDLAVHFFIFAEPRCSVLSRLLGFISQLDLAAPELRVSTSKGEMEIRMTVRGLSTPLAAILHHRMEAQIGVASVHMEIGLHEAA